MIRDSGILPRKRKRPVRSTKKGARSESEEEEESDFSEDPNERSAPV